MGCHQADAAEQAAWRSMVNDRVLRSRRRGVNRAEGRLHLRIAMFRVTVSLLPASSKLGQVGYGLPPFAAAKNEAR